MNERLKEEFNDHVMVRRELVKFKWVARRILRPTVGGGEADNRYIRRILKQLASRYLSSGRRPTVVVGYGPQSTGPRSRERGPVNARESFGYDAPSPPTSPRVRGS